MTSLGAIPPGLRSDLREELRRRAGEWLSRFYRHEVLVARTVRGMQVEAVEEFNRAVVNPLLKAVGGTLSSFQPRGNDIVPQLFPEIAALRTEIDAVVSRGSDAVRRLTERRMQEIADQEVTWTTRAAKAATGDDRFGAVVEPKAQVSQAVQQRPWLGDSTEKWFVKLLAVPTADAVKAWVSTGITQGLTTDEIVRGLRGTKDQTGILADKPTYAVAALVRTAATHASSVARAESFKSLGVGHWRFVATLDSKTSVQCAAQDGKVYEIGKGPMPPLHPSCRSSAVPVFDPNEAAYGDRATVDGPTSADKTFPEWLQSQSKARQDEVLGKTKAEAWRSGRLPIEKMLGADLQPLTLQELRDMDRL